MTIKFENPINKFNDYSNYLLNLDPTQRAWIEVSGNAIKNNVRTIKSVLKKNCKFMAVVKADGYGHDSNLVSKYAIEGGADQLGVATLQEGIHLRREGINIPILVLGNIYSKKDLLICFQNNLMPTVSSLRECLICNEIAGRYKANFLLHLKIDTGMSRLGFEINNFKKNFNKIKAFKNIFICGIYSHLSSADEDNSSNKESFTQLQKRKFIKLLKDLNIENHPEIIIHLANSAGTFLGQDFHFDMVRVGLSMYGYIPQLNPITKLKLKPALFLKSKVTFIRTIEKDIGVSYGRQFTTRKKTKLAVVSIGYADGINRNLSNQISLIHNGKFYPQVGAITMDQLMVDITASEDIRVGDTMLLLGSENDKLISPIEWATKSSSIPWEILCSFKNRLPRVQIP